MLCRLKRIAYNIPKTTVFQVKDKKKKGQLQTEEKLYNCDSKWDLVVHVSKCEPVNLKNTRGRFHCVGVF